MEAEQPKTINITGTNNKYKMKKLIHKDTIKEPKKRVISDKWTFSEECFEYRYQMKLIKDILNKYNNFGNEINGNEINGNEINGNEINGNEINGNEINGSEINVNALVETSINIDKDIDVAKIIKQQINKKISSYKCQDKIKNRLDNDKFITFVSIIEKMVECELKCRYCKEEMNVLYDISREMKQWSVDRVLNKFGHNIDNFHLACLECNLKRRCKTHDKFLFTKQLNIVKQK